jgi:hypothetical protein
MTVTTRAVETVLGLNYGLAPKPLADEVMRIVRLSDRHTWSSGDVGMGGVGYRVKCKCSESFYGMDSRAAFASQEAHQSAIVFAAVQ